MRMEIDSDQTVRTISATIEDGPDLINDWATWRKTPKPFRLRTITVTVRSGQVTLVTISGPYRKKDGSDAVNGDTIQLYTKDLESEPEWLRKMVADMVNGITNATYPNQSTTSISKRS